MSQQDHWIGLCGLVLEPAHYLQYVMMFVMGIVASRKEWLTRMGDRTGAVALTVGVALAVGNYMRDGGPWDAFVWRWFGIYESFMCVSISFGLPLSIVLPACVHHDVSLCRSDGLRSLYRAVRCGCLFL